MDITTGTPSDARDRNGGSDSTAKNKCEIMVTQTQDGIGNELLTPTLPPSPLEGATDGAAGHAAGSAGVNGTRGGETIANPPPMVYQATFHT